MHIPVLSAATYASSTVLSGLSRTNFQVDQLGPKSRRLDGPPKRLEAHQAWLTTKHVAIDAFLLSGLVLLKTAGRFAPIANSYRWLGNTLRIAKAGAFLKKFPRVDTVVRAAMKPVCRASTWGSQGIARPIGFGVLLVGSAYAERLADGKVYYRPSAARRDRDYKAMTG